MSSESAGALVGRAFAGRGMGLAFYLRSNASLVHPRKSSPQPAFRKQRGYNGVPKFGCYGQSSLFGMMVWLFRYPWKSHMYVARVCGFLFGRQGERIFSRNRRTLGTRSS
jgi:hypothetical protein